MAFHHLGQAVGMALGVVHRQEVGEVVTKSDAARKQSTAVMRRPSSQAASPIASWTRAVAIHSGAQSDQLPILPTVAVRSPSAMCPARKQEPPRCREPLG